MKTIKLKRTYFFYHILFWLLYVCLEYLANLPHLHGELHLRMIRSILLTLPIIALPTYFIVFYAIPKYLKKNNIVGFIIICVLFGIFILLARIKWLEIINYLESGVYGKMPYTKVLKNVIRDYSTVALAICIYIISDWRVKAKENKQLIIAKNKTDIDLLKRQLHPHFLFNTLNNIYSLAIKKSDQTSKSILILSNLLDYLVYQSQEKEVELMDEIDLIKNYISLEQLRYDNKLMVTYKINDLEGIRTPPLLLLPFIENCFKHGAKNTKGIFEIFINIEYIRNTLILRIRNSKSNRKQSNCTHSGLGLKNIKERLELLFKNRHTLSIIDEVDFFTVSLSLTLANGKI